jgi:nucleotide-binding universal stress UspA family protein
VSTRDAARGRVVLATNALTPRTLAAAATAIELAGALGRELYCLFVEDIELVHAAALPFTREVGTVSATARPFELADLDRALRASARELEAAVMQLAQAAGIRCAFARERGALVALALDRAARHEPLVIAAPGWPGDVRTDRLELTRAALDAMRAELAASLRWRGGTVLVAPATS